MPSTARLWLSTQPDTVALLQIPVGSLRTPAISGRVRLVTPLRAVKRSSGPLGRDDALAVAVTRVSGANGMEVVEDGLTELNGGREDSGCGR